MKSDLIDVANLYVFLVLSEMFYNSYGIHSMYFWNHSTHIKGNGPIDCHLNWIDFLLISSPLVAVMQKSALNVHGNERIMPLVWLIIDERWDREVKETWKTPWKELKVEFRSVSYYNGNAMVNGKWRRLSCVLPIFATFISHFCLSQLEQLRGNSRELTNVFAIILALISGGGGVVAAKIELVFCVFT